MPKAQSNTASAADILRRNLYKTKINKDAEKKEHPTLSESGGIDYLREKITSKIYNSIFHYKKYLELGNEIPKSFLIYGTDGVGKNYLINAFSSEYSVPIFTSFLTSALEVRELFRKAANLENFIILIDQPNIHEASTDVGNLNEGSNVEMFPIIAQIKESTKKIKEGGIVVHLHRISQTNIPVDSKIFIRIPNMGERKELLLSLLKNTKKSNSINFDLISQNTPGFVPRDICKLIKMASERAVSRAIIQSSDCLLIEDDFLSSLDEWNCITEIVTFDNIGGLDLVKEELRMSIILPAMYPQKFKKLGISHPAGVLLYGPPGCGKTLIAKAVSCMSHYTFIPVKMSEIITKYVGDSEKHLTTLFEKAKNLSPCVLFFDEIDTLCSKRGSNDFGNRIVNQVLTLLDGLNDRGEVYVIGATNRIEEIDPALLRSGRFGKTIEVPKPNREEGYEVFRKCISSIPVEVFDHKILNFEGLSGADISGIVKEAATLYLRENFDNKNPLITMKYFIQAVEKLEISKGSHSVNEE